MKPGLRQFLAVLLLGACLVLLYRSAPQLLTQKIVELDDFVEYWAAGRLNLQGGNPYSREQLTPVQLETGRSFQVPVMMWNPPWTLPLVMPFGALPYPFSRILWFLGETALLFFCATFIWNYYRGSPAHSWVAWLLALALYRPSFCSRRGKSPSSPSWGPCCS